MIRFLTLRYTRIFIYIYKMKRVTHVSPSSSVAASSSMDFFSRLLMALSTSLGCNPSFNLSLALTDGKFSEGHGTMPRFEFLQRQIGSLTTFLITSSCESCNDYFNISSVETTTFLVL